MALYHQLPTEGCNLEIMGYPFYAESVSPNEAFRRREYNFNNLVGGTQKVIPGAFIGLDFSITTHVFIDPNRPDEHNSIFQEMVSKPVEVISPELGGKFNAIVTIKPERDRLDSLKLTIGIKEVPSSKSGIPGEVFTVPKSRDVEPEENDGKKGGKDGDKNKGGKNDNKKGGKNDTKKGGKNGNKNGGKKGGKNDTKKGGKNGNKRKEETKKNK